MTGCPSVRAAGAGLIAALVIAASGNAQTDPALKEAAALPDGRSVRLLGDDFSYRLDVDGAAWSGSGDGRPLDMIVTDLDDDGAADIVVIRAAASGDGSRVAEVWDLTFEGPMLMHVSNALSTGEPSVPQLERELEARRSVADALASLQYADETVGRDLDPATATQVRDWIAQARAALVFANVAEARAAVRKAPPGETDAALSSLRRALETRARYAASNPVGRAPAPPALSAPVPVPPPSDVTAVATDGAAPLAAANATEAAPATPPATSSEAAPVAPIPAPAPDLLAWPAVDGPAETSTAITEATPVPETTVDEAVAPPAPGPPAEQTAVGGETAAPPPEIPPEQTAGGRPLEGVVGGQMAPAAGEAPEPPGTP